MAIIILTGIVFNYIEILKKNLRFSRAHTSELVQSFEVLTRDGSLSKDTFGSSVDFICDEDINRNMDNCPINEDVPVSRQRQNFSARPPLYYGMGIASRAPIHTVSERSHFHNQ